MRHAARRRRLARLRMTALPIFFVAVKPARVRPFGSSRREHIWMTSPGRAALAPLRARKKSRRWVIRAARSGKLGCACSAAIRPTDACGPWHDDVPEPGGHSSWPDASGNHGGACGPGLTAGMYVSRVQLPTGLRRAQIRHAAHQNSSRGGYRSQTMKSSGTHANCSLMTASYQDFTSDLNRAAFSFSIASTSPLPKKAGTGFGRVRARCVAGRASMRSNQALR